MTVGCQTGEYCEHGFTSIFAVKQSFEPREGEERIGDD